MGGGHGGDDSGGPSVEYGGSRRWRVDGEEEYPAYFMASMYLS